MSIAYFEDIVCDISHIQLGREWSEVFDTR